MTALATVPARFDQPCPCGSLILAGDPIHGVRNSTGVVWLHAACAARAYRLAGEAPPARPGALPCGHRAVYRRGPRAGLCRACYRSGALPVPDPATTYPDPTHRAVNGAGVRCETCDRRIIVGRDGAPVAGASAGAWRHPACPPNRRRATA